MTIEESIFDRRQTISVTEFDACSSIDVDIDKFNTNAVLPYGLTIDSIYHAMCDFVSFSNVVSKQLNANSMDRLESIMMPASYSSMVSEFMVNNLEKHSSSLVKNIYHNGHPDLVPSGVYQNNSCQYGSEGIEVKSSRYDKNWQGHNAENSWIMVFCFESNRPVDKITPIPFRFKHVYLAKLDKDDWNVSADNPYGRRTRTATINKFGHKKLTTNWIYNGGNKNDRV